MRSHTITTEKAFSALFIAGIALLLSLSLLSPSAYAPYAGEDGIMENLTALFFLISAYLCLKIFLFKRTIFSRIDIFILLLAAALFFVAGEEVSWGQRFIGYKPIETGHYQRDLALHNLKGFEDIVHIVGFAGLFTFLGALPILSYLSSKAKKCMVKLNIPLTHPFIPVSVLLGILSLFILPTVNYGTGFFYGISVENFYAITELRELFISFVMVSYLCAEYFSLLKHNKIYDLSDRSLAGSDAEHLPSSIGKDLVMLLKNNAIFITCLALLLVSAPRASTVWIQYRKSLDHQIYYNDPDITIIEGESINDSNAEYLIKAKPNCFAGKYMTSKYTTDSPKDGYYFFRYTIPVEISGKYKIFLAGAPPGSLETGLNKYFCPFDIYLDGARIKEITEESYKKDIIEAAGSDFLAHYRYRSAFRITKLGEFELEQGDNVLEFRISKKPVEDDQYKFYVDALFILPVDWEPKETPFSLPEDLFSY